MLSKNSFALFVFAVFILVQQKSFSFGRVSFGSCQLLFPRGGQKPIVQSSLRNLIEASRLKNESRSSSSSASSSASFSSSFSEILNENLLALGLNQSSRSHIKRLAMTRPELARPLIASLNSIQQKIQAAPSVLKTVLREIVEKWLEIALERSPQSASLAMIDSLPSRLDKMLDSHQRKSNLEVLILKQNLEDFAELTELMREAMLSEMAAGPQTEAKNISERTSERTSERIIEQILRDPNAFPKLKSLRDRLASLSTERRNEFAKSCIF